MNFKQYLLVAFLVLLTVVISKNRKDICSIEESFPFLGVGMTSLLALLAYFLCFNDFDIDVIVDELLLRNPSSWIAGKIISLSYLFIYIGIFMQLVVFSKKYKRK